ncbi:putative tRNA (cytidine(32)/guanosine(34)-2'-O)-methyltransferase isoform X1 [Paramacrobiotus metropolitanus]|uniref:putative tRNA (cytidine(32)/guanosine(34)-2'-O)-methyltransferase isoform X1 n=1 Tax=Paramacrobiotus metropolitanus TaxID=2943436 RepID=UPI002445F5CC|nr:putative tRNA (cytidine(32)/guanosine(34)-2'-O)-methyltransferase isoform X1 [Paramacrobiotus metropolitanus]XP_055343444.1 putative tRNA (cytidine(32)/guanosine(34)-2'-O)-methyltransferase isoform X1 [Paramacrobiotus metropolitanus]XP_055343445.1 putative tRNA (cytidine(32)/guanosine(34)-2'-O)-methyltransferase isoform X1 [Paramacrobiotus metropolitanus]
MGKCTKDNRDVYYRNAKQEGYRARSAFKLLNLNKSTGGTLFKNVKRAVDLCAAPGSWSQVLSQEIFTPQQSDPSVKIVAVDFQFMVPIPGVVQLQGDITKMSTVEKILAEFGGEQADLIVCDGAPDVTGLHELDVYRHHDIVLATLALTTAVLKYGGTLVMKVFKRKNDDLLRQQIAAFFRTVTFEKPEGSRDSSLEHFALCTDHFCPDGYQPRMLLDYLSNGDMSPYLNTIVPFIVYGDLTSILRIQPNSPSKQRKCPPVASREEHQNALDRPETIRDKKSTENAAQERDLPADAVSERAVWESRIPPLTDLLKSLDHA